MKIQVNDATPIQLNYLAAKCEGKNSIAACYYGDDDTPLWLDEAPNPTWEPSTIWAQGGPIIEREGIAIDCERSSGHITGWVACNEVAGDENWDSNVCYGPTPLIAAMRCYVASRLGDEVDVPDELIYDKGDE